MSCDNYVLDKLHSGTNLITLGLSSMLMNRQYILNKVPLKRNTYETRLYVNWLINKLWSKAQGVSFCFSGVNNV